MSDLLSSAHRRFPTTIHLSLDSSLPGEIKVLPIGTFETTKYCAVEITDELRQKYIRTFNTHGKGRVRFNVEHRGSQHAGVAAGWFADLLYRAGDGLCSVVKWTKLGEGLVRPVSPWQIKHRPDRVARRRVPTPGAHTQCVLGVGAR